MRKQKITHCSRCGGTGRTFDGVPGSFMNGVKMTFHQYAPKSKACNVCDGTGHLVESLRKEPKEKGKNPKQMALELPPDERGLPDETYLGAPHKNKNDRISRDLDGLTKGAQARYVPKLEELLGTRGEAYVGNLSNELPGLPKGSRYDIAKALIRIAPLRYRLIKPAREGHRKSLIITTNMAGPDETIRNEEETE